MGFLCATLLILFNFKAQAAPSAFSSQLFEHPSPYLAMHAQDPVQWRLWQKSTLQLAKRQNKLILLSSGYFSCHWCHVMQQEVYQNPQTAQQLNQDFISIKIDRELNPQLDSQMIDFARKYRGSAGWPQHLILTPDGLPFAAFTYLPNNQLQKLLTAVDKLWKENPIKINQLAESAITFKDQLLKEWQPVKFKQALYQQLPTQIDEFSGGLNGSNKFPNTPLLLALVQQQDLPTAISDWLLLTLQKMHSEHLFDHLYGGFFRYTIDPEWQTPHFEKMLYDNAQLLELYLLADLRWPNQGFASVADATLGYLRSYLYSPKLKLYLGSQSAVDTENREGRAYLFSKQELQQILDKSAYQQVAEEWLDNPAPFDLGYQVKPTEQNWPIIKQQLLQARPKARMPIDSKAIVGWNALLLKALVTASAWHKQRTDFSLTPNLAKAPDYTQELATELLVLSRNQKIPRALIYKNSPVALQSTATLSDLSYLWDALNAWEQQEKIDLDLTSLQRKLLALKQQDGWNVSQNLSLYPQNSWIIKDDAVPSSSAKLGCGLVPVKIDQDDFYLNPIDYASYLLLRSWDNCR